MSATYAGIVASATLGTVVPIACSLGGPGNRHGENHDEISTDRSGNGLVEPCLATGTITKLARRGAVLTRSQLAKRCTLYLARRTFPSSLAQQLRQLGDVRRSAPRAHSLALASYLTYPRSIQREQFYTDSEQSLGPK
jgi:hypothetical protein